jgi:hypothetical protein
MSINLNVNIPYSLHKQIKQQLKYNKIFQEINHVPNLIKETKFLKDRTHPQNFQLLEKKHRKAKQQFVEVQSEVKEFRK